MGKNEREIRFCKSKKCMKPLPDGYQHQYCEACRNRHAEAARNVLKGVGAAAGAAFTLVAVAAAKGKIDPKESLE